MVATKLLAIISLIFLSLILFVVYTYIKNVEQKKNLDELKKILVDFHEEVGNPTPNIHQPRLTLDMEMEILKNKFEILNLKVTILEKKLNFSLFQSFVNGLHELIPILPVEFLTFISGWLLATLILGLGVILMAGTKKK